MNAPPPYARRAEKGIELFVWAKPGAAAEKIIGLKQDDKGQFWLHISVCAAPEDGKANTALQAFLAKKLGVRKSAIQLSHGAVSKQKRFLIAEKEECLTWPALPLRD